ncbi:MAG: glycosyltransferase 87 family protein [Actinomycetota bacterium]|nr:glycosyltransferase 87 family protein [Actinomycetota bacterium]
MKVGLLYSKVQTDDRRLRWSLWALFVGSAALGLYFLIEPIGGELYYKVGHDRTAHQFSREVLPLFIPWGLALMAWRQGLRVPLKLLFGAALVLHLIVLLAPPAMSQDFYQYLFYGRIQVEHGGNPYLHLPSEFWLDRWFAWTRWHDQTSVYGPLWMLITAGVARMAGDSLTLAFMQLKMVILALDVTVMALIVYGAKLLRPARGEDGDGLFRSNGGSDWEGAAGFGLLAFAWNPLVLVSIPLSGAVDVVLAAAFVGALVARRIRRPGLATVLLALAALVKVYAVAALGLHLLLLARERNWRTAIRHGAASAAIAAVAYAPYWAGWRTFNGLIQAFGYTNHSLVGAVQDVLISFLRLVNVHPAAPVAEMVMRIVITPVLIGVAIWAVRRVRDEDTLWKSVLVVLSAYLFLTPWFMYWYIVGVLALVAALPRNRLTDPILVFSGTSVIATWWFPFIEEVPATLQRVLQAALRYVPPVLVFRRQQRRTVPPAEPVPSARSEYHQPVGAGESRGTGG